MIAEALLWWLGIAVLIVLLVGGYAAWLWIEATCHGDEWGEP